MILCAADRTAVTRWTVLSPAGPGRSHARTGAAGCGATAAPSAGTAGTRGSAVSTTRSSLSVGPGNVWRTKPRNVTGNRIVRTALMNTRAVVSPHSFVLSVRSRFIFRPSPPPARLCLAPRYRCSDGRCLPAHNVCDGEFDCLDGGDEDKCQCTSVL